MINQDIKRKLEKAINCLFEKQEDIFDYTLESGFTEWNLTHHLAFEINQQFPEYHVSQVLFFVLL